MRAAYLRKAPVQGSRHKYLAMLERVCEMVPSTQGGVCDFAVMFGVAGGEHKDYTTRGIPYLLVANDVGGMRWPHKRTLEQKIMRDAACILSNSPGTAEWMEREYGVSCEVVLLRPLAADLDFEPLPKLEGQNIAYCGGIRANDPKYPYRDYSTIFPELQKAGWTVHVYPAWGATRDLESFTKMGVVIHNPVPQGRLYRELSQYQAGFQGYGPGQLQHYVDAARPNKYWEYLAAGIPTLGYNAGSGAMYDGVWGAIAQTFDEIPAATERVLSMTIPDELRREQVIDGDIDVFRRLVAKASGVEPLDPDRAITVGIIGQGNIGGQISLVPPLVREQGIECYGFSKYPSKFGYPLDNHGVPTDFISTADILHVDVSYESRKLFPLVRNPRYIIHQHGHLDRKGDAGSDELQMDRELGAVRYVSTINLLDPYVGGDASRWMPSMLNPGIEKIRRPRKRNSRVLVVHSPSKRENKHTDDIIYAVETLQRCGVPVDLDIIEGTDNLDCIKRKAKGDICFDQLTHCYGQSAVECMYFGIPVIVGLTDEVDAKVQEVTGMRPYIRATPHTLALVLHDLVMDEKKRQEIGAVGAEYARKYHTPEAVAKRRAEIYRYVMGLPKKEQPTDPRKFKLAVNIPDFGGRRYHKGEYVPIGICRKMKAAGLLKDPKGVLA